MRSVEHSGLGSAVGAPRNGTWWLRLQWVARLIGVVDLAAGELDAPTVGPGVDHGTKAHSQVCSGLHRAAIPTWLIGRRVLTAVRWPGFGSWDLIIFAMESLPPSQVDEDIDEKLANERTRSYANVLVSRCGMAPGEALYVGALPPSSNRRYEAFKHGDGIALYSDQLRAFEDFAHEVADSEIGQEIGEEIEIASQFWIPPDPEKVRVALQLCGAVEEEPWIDIFTARGWHFRVFSEYQTDVGEASFVIHDDVLGEIPAYLTPTATEPKSDLADFEDRVQILQRNAYVGDFVTEWKVTSRVGLLLSRWPWILKRDGRAYCHLGSVYDAEHNRWKDLLFNQNCTSVRALLALNEQVTDIHQGCPALEDNDGEFAQFATVCLSWVDIAESLTGNNLDLVSALNVDTE